MKNAIVLILLSAILISCRKEKQEFTISGKLMLNCSGQPMSNEKIFVVQSNDGVNFNSDELGETSTDADGNFTIKYLTGNFRDNDYIELKTAAGAGFADLMVGIPPGKNITDLKLYLQPTTNLKVNIQVSKSYNPGDTLMLSDRRLPGYHLVKIPAPINSGEIYTATHMRVNGMRYSTEKVYRDEQTGTATIEWYMKTNTGNTKKEVIWFPIDKFCTQTETVTVVIE